MSDGTITRAQLRAAYDALGLPPDRFDMTGHIDMDPDRVVIYRLVIGDDHRPLFMRHEKRIGRMVDRDNRARSHRLSSPVF